SSVRPHYSYTPLPYTTLFRSDQPCVCGQAREIFLTVGRDTRKSLHVYAIADNSDAARIKAVLAHQEIANRLGIGDDECRQILNRSEEHTSELQSPCNFVCGLL